MAFWLLLFTLAVVVTNGYFSTNEISSGEPRFTSCRSPELQTFTCHWTYGDFHNLTGLVNVIFTSRSDLIWRGCPDYKSAGENSCYFNSSYTSMWIDYCLKLVHDNTSLHEYCFNVEDIFQPDPPIGLNWTLLNLSVSGVNAQVQVRWKPPPSADKDGWINLVYELQYKEANETTWNKLEPAFSTTVPVYLLRVDREYEIRVRCRGIDSGNFGEFSEMQYVSFPQFSPAHLHDQSLFPWPLFIIFGTLAAAAVLLLIKFSKQKRLRPCEQGFCNRQKVVQLDIGTGANA